MEKIILRPSNAARWSRCPKSETLILELAKAGYLDLGEGDDFTNEGTAAHALAAKALGKSVSEQEEALIEEWYCFDMENNVNLYVDFVRSLSAAPTDVLYVESQVRLFYDDKTTGTADAIVIQPKAKKIFINDLKYGAGVPVAAFENRQLAVYLWSVVSSLEVNYFTNFDRWKFQINIVQPRAAGADGNPVKSWDLSYEELKAFIKPIEAMAKRILTGDKYLDYSASRDACRFCPALPFCTTYKEYIFNRLPNKILNAINQQTLPDMATLTPEEISEILDCKSDIVQWFNKVETMAKNLASNGVEIPNYKLVQSLGNRAWVNEDLAEKFLASLFDKDEYTKTVSKLSSPTQAEKLLKVLVKENPELKKDFESLVVRPLGNPTLVKNADGRPEVKARTPEELFGDI